MDIAAILKSGADIIRTFGHTKGMRRDLAGRVCALGALEYGFVKANPSYIVAGFNLPVLIENVVPAVVEALAKHLPPTECGRGHRSPAAFRIADWNNQPERTAEEVITMMEFAALCVEEEAKLADVEHAHA